MKYFLDISSRRLFCIVAAALGLLSATVAAIGELSPWIRNIEAGSALEAVFFRMMSLPKGAVAFRRPPAETRPALRDLINSQPHNAELYSLRALEDEQQLDFAAAEFDWKAYVDNSSDKINAQLALADFYHRRVRPADEIKTLSLVATAPPIAAEKLIPPAQQRSWQAFERIFSVIQAQGLPKDSSIHQYRAWIARYPNEPSLYSRFLQFLIAEKEYASAPQLIADYHKQFPNDQIFPVKAKATLEYSRGSVAEGLAVYEQSFQPLWDPQLVKSYFDLLRETQNLRKFLSDARAALAKNSEDLNATARIFYYYQQQGKLEAAQQAIGDLRLRKEEKKSAWTSQELYVCARLLEEIHAYPESGRYYFALYNSNGMPDAQETAIAGLTNLLLTAPETPIRLGSGNLSMYRDIATLDQGPGYLNGILSLILNTTQPATQYAEEDQRGIPYFRRSRAAELLALLDKSFPKSLRRPELHAQLLEFYANSGESEVVIREGRAFLTNFPDAPQRTQVALLMADAYARGNDTQDEFAVYDSVLQELASKAQNMPLGAAASDYEYREPYNANYQRPPNGDAEAEEETGETEQDQGSQNIPQRRASQSFQIETAASSSHPTSTRSSEYSSVLERYLARLVQTRQIPAALAVLSREIERNPDDPGLYERLATFLEQNRLGSQQEEVYRRAIARFSDKTWYDRLARFYLRYKRNQEFAELTRQAVSNFQGSELEQYFNHVVGGTPALYLSLNQYAHQRFPHNPVFVRNLLLAYRRPETLDLAAWEALLREHWFENETLRNQFFEFLSSRNKLEEELSALRQSTPDAASWEKNPAAVTFLAYGNLWRSHFEESAPFLSSLSAQYPANAEIANDASSVFRSLAYFERADTAIAARIQDKLLQGNPGDSEIMARIGDIYADRELFEQASPYWERIPQITPGRPDGYLEAATIYWDYFDFDNAMRLLNTGRTRLGNLNLYAYEAGAIYENERDYPRAIDEYVKGALAAPDSSAEHRLLQLAVRPKLREIVDQATAKIISQPNPSMPAVYLRVKVLEAQDRRAEMQSFLDSVLNGTTSLDQAEDLETLAQQKSLETVRQHVLEKEAVLTTDPVTRLQLHYALVRLYEGRKDFPAAQNNVEALYRENPKILGVVRSTVDFYWRTNQKRQAIAVLLQAAKDAYPALGAQFTFEAARKSTETRQFQQARGLLAVLLKDSPYDGEYLAAVADTYAQSGDDQGLTQFYTEKIALFRIAPLSTEERKTKIAALRRGLIPALTRLNDYSGAIDQYIELIDNFPEDGALVTEAALYALRYQRQQQLVDFYSKTVARSPRDSRWAVVLASIQTSLENYSDAIDTYAKAIAVRPDRVDLYIARAGLEERLMRFDDAAADYEHVYQLAYKDPQWMEKIATLRAREGKVKEVVDALQAALINGRPESAGNYFEVARRLDAWNLLDEARAFADQGVTKAGSDLLANSQNHAGAQTYVRIMTRLRRYDEAFTTLQKALDESGASLPVLKDQIERQGIVSVTNSQWREHERRNRMETARSGMTAALREMGAAINSYLTPEERQAFAEFAESKKKLMLSNDVESFAVPLAESAGLADQEARWRFEWIMQSAPSPNYYPNAQPFIDLQKRRGRFAELGSQLEQFADARQAARTSGILLEAADAYRSADDEAAELRTLSRVFSMYGLDASREQRFFHLLLNRDPQQLVRIAANWPSASGEQAADYVIAHGSAALAHSVVQARGKPRTPVWNQSYDALVGLYFAEPTPEIHNAFLAALGDNPIGARIGKPINRDEQLAGNTWFYYGSRYGEYLGISKSDNPDDFLPAIIEESPASAPGYLILADYYAGANSPTRAIDDYNHALELVPNRPDIFDSLALVYFKNNDRAAALAQWKQALAVLSQQLSGPRVPENFWSDFGRICDHLAARHLFADLKPDADTIVRAYLRHNGNYRSNALLHSVYAATANPASATDWLLDLATSAPDPVAVLADVADASWIPLANRAPIYQRIIDLKERAVAKLDGLQHQYAEEDLGSWRVRWIQYLVRTKQYAAADAAIVALSQSTKDAQAAVIVPLELRSAAQLATLDTKLAAYRAELQHSPAPEILRAAARELFEAGDKESARKILELVFSREIVEHKLVAANFLGLAEIRLASGDTAGALDLLRRLVVVVGDPFENLDPAAALLEKTGHNAEAIEFLDGLVKSSPWELSYRVRLAKAKLAAGKDTAAAGDSLSAIASSPNAPYDLRLKAAAAIAGQPHSDLGSAELNLLAGNPPAVTAPVADKFYFYAARVKAAQNATDPQTKLQLLSHCIIDFPRRDDARIPLFQAAVAAHSGEYALGVIGPLLEKQFLRNYTPVSTTDEEMSRTAAVDDEQEDAATNPNSQVVAGSSLGRTQQAEISRMIGDTLMRLDRPAEAIAYYETARQAETSPTTRKNLSHKIAEINALLRAEQRNATRRPILHEALEQDRVVRPRILAPQPASAKGDVKP